MRGRKTWIKRELEGRKEEEMLRGKGGRESEGKDKKREEGGGGERKIRYEGELEGEEREEG